MIMTKSPTIGTVTREFALQLGALAISLLLVTASGASASAADVPNKGADQASPHRADFAENQEPDNTCYDCSFDFGVAKQSLAMPFNLADANTLTGFTVHMSNEGQTANGSNPNAGVYLGVMADKDGVPSGVFLRKTFVYTPSNSSDAMPITISGRNWTLKSNTRFWLVAVAASGAQYSWSRGSSKDVGAIESRNGSWTTGKFAFAATINGTWVDPALVETSPLSAPAPVSLAMLAIGVIGIGLGRQHGMRDRKGARFRATAKAG